MISHHFLEPWRRRKQIRSNVRDAIAAEQIFTEDTFRTVCDVTGTPSCDVFASNACFAPGAEVDPESEVVQYARVRRLHIEP